MSAFKRYFNVKIKLLIPKICHSKQMENLRNTLIFTYFRTLVNCHRFFDGPYHPCLQGQTVQLH
jgi:hypothetical protein